MNKIDIFPWDNHFNTGLDEVDSQHRKLVDILNRIASQTAFNTQDDVLSGIFEELIDYTVYHFEYEERIWQKYFKGESLDTEHRESHQAFINTVQDFKNQLGSQSIGTLLKDALDFLARWLASHILETDRHMAFTVLAMEQGLSFDEAKSLADKKMTGSTRFLIDLILSIYSTLSSNTLKLLQELKTREDYEKKLRDQKVYQDLLLNLTSSFVNTPVGGLDQAIQQALEKMAVFVDADRCYIFSYDLTSGKMSNDYEWCAENITPQKPFLQNIPVDLSLEMLKKHQQGKHDLVENVARMENEALRASLQSQDIKSLVTVPVFQKGVCSGFIGFDVVRVVRIFQKNDIALLKVFASLLGSVFERNQIQSQLNHERYFLRSLYQAIPDLVWLKDPDGVYLSCNKRFEAFFGASESNIIGKTDYDFVEKSLADYFRKHDVIVMNSGQANVNEESVQFASDGHYETLHTTKTPMYKSDGSLLGILGVGRDISDLKSAQASLKLKEHYQRAVLDNSPFLIWLKDSKSQFLVVNHAFAKACKAETPDELTGKTDLDIWPKELAEKYRKDDAAVIASGQAKMVEERVGTHEPYTWMETYKSPIALNGEGVGTVGFARDITDNKTLHRDLIIERNRLKNYLETVDAMIVSLDRQGKIVLINRKGCEVLGYTQDEILHQQWFEKCLPQPDGMNEIYPVFLSLIQGNLEQADYFENEILTKQGERRLIAWRNSYLFDDDNQIVGILSAGDDITERKVTEERLQLAASVYTHSHEGILITSAANKILDVNQAAEQISGYEKSELIGKNPKILGSDQNDNTVFSKMWIELNRKGYWAGEFWNQHKDGSNYAVMTTITAIKNDAGQIIRYVGLFSDITQLKTQQEQLEYIAHYDALTGLPNRVLLSDRLEQAIAHCKRNKTILALVYLDLDGFKFINDSYGHATGDHLLKTVSNRMKSALRDGDTIARIGGDEFVTILQDFSSVSASIPMLKRLVSSVSQPMEFKQAQMQVTASLGVAFCHASDKIDADQLLRQADQAMYQAKLLGKNRFVIFDEQEDASIRNQNEKLEALEFAITHKQMALYYQPKVNMKTGDILGFEALIRWNHPQEGLLSPGFFLPAIQGNSLNIKLGMWVLENAFKALSTWKEAGINIQLCINIDALHLLNGDINQHLKALFGQYPTVMPENIKLEILETSALEDIEKVADVMEICRASGVTFALDDFGTGYSSLTYLKRLQVAELKIDQSFVRDMLHDSNDLTILDGVIGLATAFHMDVVAEGVESIEHGKMLLRMGCEVGQGYVIARPMPESDVLNWISHWQPFKQWQGMKKVPREHLPALYAITEHNDWYQTTLNYIEKKGAEKPETNPENCRFGKWLYADGFQTCLPQPEFEKIEALHRALHDEGKQLMNDVNQPTKSASIHFENFERLHESLIKMLEDMILLFDTDAH